MTWPALEVAEAALPILRLASDLIRKLIAADRRQTTTCASRRCAARSARCAASSARASGIESFENADPERLRA